MIKSIWSIGRRFKVSKVSSLRFKYFHVFRIQDKCLVWHGRYLTHLPPQFFIFHLASEREREVKINVPYSGVITKYLRPVNLLGGPRLKYSNFGAGARCVINQGLSKRQQVTQFNSLERCLCTMQTCLGQTTFHFELVKLPMLNEYWTKVEQLIQHKRAILEQDCWLDWD